MKWTDIVGQESLKQQLKDSILQKRVSHAQLFLGKEGYGTLPLALAYAREIFEGDNHGASDKIDHIAHLDLHFSFPVYSVDGKSLSRNFFQEFRTMMLENPYFSIDDWSAKLASENKQLFISVHEVEEWSQCFALKSFEGGHKVLIVWNADKMKTDTSNKLLKLLEEPPEKTVIILTAESEQNFLQTILSRTQVVEVPRIEDEAIKRYLASKYAQLTEQELDVILFQAQGDLNEAIKRVEYSGVSSEFEVLFVQWVREAFQVIKRPELLRNIILWARNIASWSREKQRNFLYFCAEMFRLALMQNYSSANLVYKTVEVQKFNWDAFSKFIHGANIESILEQISLADYHLQRNANAKIVWTDLGIKLSRYIHRKAI